MSSEWPTICDAILAEIKAERAALGLQVGELAERVGIHPGSMPRYVSGERDLPLRLLEKLARELNMDLPTLVRRADERLRRGVLHADDY